MSPTDAGRWVPAPRPRPDVRLRLFCLPYAGGGATIFRQWPNDLPAAVEVRPIHLPGREARLSEPARLNLDTLVAEIVAAITPLLDRPFAIFGHSMGALLAFHVTRALRQDGLQMPVHLFAAGLGAPHTPNPDPPIYALPDAEFIARIRALDGTPAEVFEHPELLELMLPILRADFTLCETSNFIEEPPLQVPLTAIGGLADTKVSRERLAAWEIHTSDRFRLRLLPGDHFFLNTLRRETLALVGEDLARALQA